MKTGRKSQTYHVNIHATFSTNTILVTSLVHIKNEIKPMGLVRMKRNILLIGIALIVTGCASNPDKIQTSYVSPLQYKDYDCDQISGELERVSRRANDLHGSLKKTSDNDDAQMAVGVVLFWPALFFLEGGDGPEAIEYSRLKGEREALEKVAIKEKCDISVLKTKKQQNT